VTPGDPVVGSTVLRRPAIQSPNFVTTVSGWTINADGSAEFNNLAIRGTFNGTDFVINSSGMFFYSPSEAAGNLIISVASSAGTDGFGNAYPKGVSLGRSGDASQVQLLTGTGGTGTASEVAFPIPTLSLSNIPNVGAGIVSGTFADLVISGPALAAAGFTDWVQAVQFSNDGSGTEARMEFRYVDTSGSAHVIASYNGTGWTFGSAVTASGGMSVSGGLTVDTINGSSSTGAGDNGGVTSGPSGTVNAFPAAGPNHTHSEFHHHPI
jgi:hypothetical protein